LSADVVGYSRLMGSDEAGTPWSPCAVFKLEQLQAEVLVKRLEMYGAA